MFQSKGIFIKSKSALSVGRSLACWACWLHKCWLIQATSCLMTQKVATMLVSWQSGWCWLSSCQISWRFIRMWFVIISMVCILKNKNINGDLSSAYVRILSETKFLFQVYKPTCWRDPCAEPLVFTWATQLVFLNEKLRVSYNFKASHFPRLPWNGA